jgi:hypothetical protein
MKLSEPTKATLYRLRRIAGDLLLTRPDQFALIGKDEKFAPILGRKTRQHAGLTVRGTLLNTLEKDVGFSAFDFIADELRPDEPVYLYDTKVVCSAGSLRARPERELVALREVLKALDDKLQAAPLCSFRIGRSEIIRSQKALRIFLASAKRAAVMARLYNEVGGGPQCELSWVPDRCAVTPELTDSYSWQLDRFEGETFAVAMTGELYKLLLPSVYEVTVYSSGVAEWIAMDHRVTFVIEDQKPRDKTVERRRPSVSPAP